MPIIIMADVKRIIDDIKRRLMKEKPKSEDSRNIGYIPPSSREFRNYVDEENYAARKGNFFERKVKKYGSLIDVNVPESMQKKLSNSLLVTDMDITPKEVFSFSVVVFLAMLGLVLIPFLFVDLSTKIMLLAIPALVSMYIITYPNFIAEITKIRAADESIKVVLYMVIFLRLNPNMIGAVEFAANHCTGPLGKDMKKMLWDIQMRKYTGLDQAIITKTDKWLLWDKNFLEAIQMLSGIGMEPTREKREEMLDKSLEYILDGTYSKMKDYGRNLRMPTLLIQTLGITFPLLGLVMFPLVSVFLSDSVNPIFLALGYTFVLPLILFWFIRRTVSKRPGAFSYPDISNHPDLPPKGKILMKDRTGKMTNIPLLPIAILVGIVIMTPGLIHIGKLAGDYLSYGSDAELWKERINEEYKPENILPSMLCSLSIIWGAVAMLSIYFYGSSFQRIKIRNEVKAMEDEFSVALFRMGEVLSKDIPLESTLEILEKKYKMYGLQSSVMYTFFTTVLANIQRLGMTFESAIFNERYGIIKKYPSDSIRDILKIIVRASKKGPHVLAVATKSISSYLGKTRAVSELMKDILDEVVSGAKMQATLIGPFICGIVSSTSVLLIQLLYAIGVILDRINSVMNLPGGSEGGGLLSSSILKIDIGHIMPPTVFQLVVGTYMIEFTVLLGFFLNGLQNGFDKTTRNYIIGKSLMTAVILYTIVMIIAIIMFAPLIYSIVEQ